MEKTYPYEDCMDKIPYKETPERTCACGHTEFQHTEVSRFTGYIEWWSRPKKCRETFCLCKKFRFMGLTYFDERYYKNFTRLGYERKEGSVYDNRGRIVR